jgi:hypothetical protein
LTIESQDLKDPNNICVSKLQLVDLAGSEKQALTGTTGQQAKEATDINKSLHVLRKVITALTVKELKRNKESAEFIPYRESKIYQHCSMLPEHPKSVICLLKILIRSF